MTDSAYDDRPLPFWLRALLRAHQSGVVLPAISHVGQPGLSKAEAGMLLRGASRIEDAVFRLRYLGQEQERHIVTSRLSDFAKTFSDRGDFAKVHCPDCLDRLVALVVDEELVSVHHQTDAFRIRYMGVSRGVWRSRYDRPHRRLKSKLEVWAGGAVACAYRNAFGN